MNRLIILILVIISFNTFSQNQIYIGTKNYPSTTSWDFSPAKRTFTDDNISIQIGKSSTGGIFMLSVASEFGRASINGAILIYLKNGKVLSLTKKIASDYADDKISVIYALITNDINEMKQSVIANVRFTYTDPLGRKMGLNARNGQIYNDGIFDRQTTEIETTTEMMELFSK